MEDPVALAKKWAAQVEEERQQRMRSLPQSRRLRKLIATLEYFEGKCSDPADAREVFRHELIGILRSLQKLSTPPEVEGVLINLQQLKPGRPKTASWGAKATYDALKKAQDAVSRDLPKELLREEPNEAVELRTAELACAVYQTFQGVSDAYVNAKRQRAAMDFDDLIAATLDGGGSASILVRTTLPDAPPIEIEEPSHFLHSPALAANHTEGAVALYDLISGLDNGLIVRRWSRGDDGDSIVKGTHYVVDVGDGAPPYAPAIAYLADDVWFVAWSEGGNPDYRVRGRFVDFEADED